MAKTPNWTSLRTASRQAHEHEHEQELALRERLPGFRANDRMSRDQTHERQ